jgi:hypothetical protein
MQETVQAARNQIHKVTNTKKKKICETEKPEVAFSTLLEYSPDNRR